MKLKLSNKHIAILMPIVALMFMMCSSSKKIDGEKESDLTKKGLVGDVKSVRIIDYEAVDNFGKIEKGEPKSVGGYMTYKGIWTLPIANYMEFDRNGNKTVEASYTYSGKLHRKWIYRYDKGRRTERNAFDANASHLLKWIYKYDAKGNIIESNIYKTNGSLSSKETYKYDNVGNLIEENQYKADGSLDSKEVYRYDSKRNRIETVKYDSNLKATDKVVFKYDSRGREIEETRHWADGSIRDIYTYKYDNRGNLAEYIDSDDDGDISERETYKHDDRGNLIEKNRFDWDDLTNPAYSTTYQYVYDQQGNWIKMTVFEKGMPEYIQERTIEYHN